MLDNTALVLIGAQGLPATHGLYSHPVIIAGSCGGYFKTGRFVRLGSRTDCNDPETDQVGRDGMVAHTRLLTSLVNAMGLDVPTVGMPDFGGALTELRA